MALDFSAAFKNPEYKILGDVGDPTRPTGGGKDFSSRVFYEPADQWWTRNLGGQRLPIDPNTDMSQYFGEAWAPWAEKTKADQAAWDAYRTANYSEGNPIGEFSPEYSGLGFNPATLGRMLDDQKASWSNIAPDSPWAKLPNLTSQVESNRPYLPNLVTGADGKQYVRYNDPEKPQMGFLDKAADMVPGAMMSAAAGMGFADILGQLGFSNPFSGLSGPEVTDAPWGVNPQGAGNMNFGDIIEELGNFTGGEGGGLGDIFSSGGNVLEEMGNVTGGGVLGSNYTWNQIANSLGINPTALATSAGKSALQKLLSGTATGPELAGILGTLGATGLGVYGANQQQNAMSDLAKQYMQMGAPYRQRLEASYADPAGFLANSPDIQAAVDQGTGALSRALSAQGGNPAASGRPLQEMQNYATNMLYGQLGNERQRLANFGGLSALTGAAPGANVAAVGQQGNVYNALGYGLDQLTRPQNSLNDLARLLGIQGVP